MAKMKNLDGRFEVKNFSYSFFKGNHSMESKIIEYGIIFLHKYKVEQTKLISRLLFNFLVKNYKKVWWDSNIKFFLTHFHTSVTVAISRVKEMFIQSHFESMQSTQSKWIIKVSLKIFLHVLERTCNLYIKLPW